MDKKPITLTYILKELLDRASLLTSRKHNIDQAKSKIEEMLVPSEKEYADFSKAPEDNRDYEPAFVEGWNACVKEIRNRVKEEK